MAVTTFFQEVLPSIFPTKDPVAIFLFLNIIIFLGVFASRKYTGKFTQPTRSGSPDLEKPSSRPGVKEKVTRKPGGESYRAVVWLYGKLGLLYLSAALQNGHHQLSKDLAQHHTQTGMSTTPSQSHIDRSDMAREFWYIISDSIR